MITASDVELVEFASSDGPAPCAHLPRYMARQPPERTRVVVADCSPDAIREGCRWLMDGGRDPDGAPAPDLWRIGLASSFFMTMNWSDRVAVANGQYQRATSRGVNVLWRPNKVALSPRPPQPDLSTVSLRAEEDDPVRVDRRVLVSRSDYFRARLSGAYADDDPVDGVVAVKTKALPTWLMALYGDDSGHLARATPFDLWSAWRAAHYFGAPESRGALEMHMRERAGTEGWEGKRQLWLGALAAMSECPFLECLGFFGDVVVIAGPVPIEAVAPHILVGLVRAFVDAPRDDMCEIVARAIARLDPEAHGEPLARARVGVASVASPRAAVAAGCHASHVEVVESSPLAIRLSWFVSPVALEGRHAVSVGPVRVSAEKTDKGVLATARASSGSLILWLSPEGSEAEPAIVPSSNYTCLVPGGGRCVHFRVVFTRRLY